MQYPGKGMSVAALVLGIVACAGFWIPMGNIVILILGIVGIILAIKGKKAATAANAPAGMATAGLVLSIIGTVVAGIGFITCTVCTLWIGNAASNLVNNTDLTELQSMIENIQ